MLHLFSSFQCHAQKWVCRENVLPTLCNTHREYSECFFGRPYNDEEFIRFFPFILRVFSLCMHFLFEQRAICTLWFIWIDSKLLQLMSVRYFVFCMEKYAKALKNVINMSVFCVSFIFFCSQLFWYISVEFLHNIVSSFPQAKIFQLRPFDSVYSASNARRCILNKYCLCIFLIITSWAQHDTTCYHRIIISFDFIWTL